MNYISMDMHTLLKHFILVYSISKSYILLSTNEAILKQVK